MVRKSTSAQVCVLQENTQLLFHSSGGLLLNPIFVIRKTWADVSVVLLGKQPKNNCIVFCLDCDKNNNSYYDMMEFEHLAHHFQLIVVYSH